MKTFLEAKWEDIIMVNYEVDEKTLCPYLRSGVELDTYEDKNFISLVGFRFINSKILGLQIPFFGNFDEVNLRFYVKRKIGSEYRRGVVFISEIVPFKIVAHLANKLYKEHYSYSKMKHEIKIINTEKRINYYWENDKNTFFIKADFETKEQDMICNSLEEFIYEHYYGYTKVNKNETWEYKVNHPKWKINKVKNYAINCDFEKIYNNHFSFLNNLKPYSVYNAIGSKVSIDRRINKLTI